MPTETTLRDLVTQRIDSALDAFQQRHPHLAAALERITLIEQTITRIQDDPDYRRAMEQAAIDNAVLTVTGAVVSLVEKYVSKAFGL